MIKSFHKQPLTCSKQTNKRKYPEQYKEELNGKFITENYNSQCEKLRGWAQLQKERKRGEGHPAQSRAGEGEEAGKGCGERGSEGCKGRSGKGKDDEPSASYNLLGGSEISPK